MAARVLVIEDNVANLDLVIYLLTAFGHQPLVAHDGVEGLDVARREGPDLVVCDLRLPRMDGYELAQQFKNDPALQDIPLIAVTAFAMTGDRHKMLARGFDGYIAKPINPETFVGEIETFLAVIWPFYTTSLNVNGLKRICVRHRKWKLLAGRPCRQGEG